MNRTQDKGIYWIKYMFEEISEKINKLFNELEQIYKVFNVQCKIKQNFSIILRVLAPIQILQRFSTTKNRYLQFRSPQSLKNYLKLIDKQINKQIVIDNSSLSSQIQLYQKLNSQSQYLLKKIQTQNKNSIKKQIKGVNKHHDHSNSFGSQSSNSKSQSMIPLKDGKKIRGRRPILDQDQQKRLLNWIEQKCRVEKVLIKQQIIRQAFIISKNQGFRPNDIWFRKFINKYPRYKDFIQKKGKSNQIHKQKQSLTNPNKNKKITYPFKSLNQQNIKVKSTPIHFIDLNQSESFEQIKEDRPNNEYHFNSQEEQVEENLNQKKELDQNEDIQLSEAVQRFQHALRGHRQEFYNKDSKSKKN